MKHRPSVDDEEIISAVSAVFNIELKALEFLPLGEGAWVYRGQDNMQRSWFIKLARDSNIAVEHATEYLHDELALGFVAAPLASKLAEPPKLKDYQLTIYPFLEGEVLGSVELSPYKAEIGDDLRQLHEAHLPDEIRSLLPVESFQKFQDSARGHIERARQHNADDPIMTSLASVVDHYAKAIADILKNGQLISEYCKAHASTYEFVVCHADIHAYNIMSTQHGLMMVDWDGMMLAPPERDLMFYANDMRCASDFHRAYGPNYVLNEALITYYAYEWVLQEFTDYLSRLFDNNLNTDARQHALDEFERLFGEGNELGGVVKDALDSPLP